MADRYCYECRLLPIRYWRHWWHWIGRSHWRLTIFRKLDGRRCGTWHLNVGPLMIARLFRV